MTLSETSRSTIKRTNTLSERRAACARSVHHQRPKDASCDGPASPTQAGTTPSRSETPLRTWRCKGLSRGTTAPCVVAQLVRCGGGGGGATRHRRPAPRWFDVTKAYQSRSCGLTQPLCSPLGRDQAYKRISGQRSQQKQRGAVPPPSSWGLDGCWEGARRHEALIANFVRTARFIVTYQS